MDLPRFTEAEIWSVIVDAESRMNGPQSLLWKIIKIEPQKWQQSPYGDSCGGFWAVGLIGTSVLWYNEIEEGFNISSYKAIGTIEEYWCNQDELEFAVQQLLKQIEAGYSPAKCGPPMPFESDR